MGALFAEYIIAKGWSAPVIAMLQVVVDKRIRGISVAMFLFMSTIFASTGSVFVGTITQEYNLSPKRTPQEYGWMIFAFMAIPQIIAMPLFLIAGYKYKALKEALAEQLDSKDEDVSIAAQKTI